MALARGIKTRQNAAETTKEKTAKVYLDVSVIFSRRKIFGAPRLQWPPPKLF